MNGSTTRRSWLRLTVPAALTVLPRWIRRAESAEPPKGESSDAIERRSRPATGGEVNWLAEVQRPPDRWPADALVLRPVMAGLASVRGSDVQPVDTESPNGDGSEAAAARADLARWLNYRPTVRRWWLDQLGWQDPGQQSPAWRVLESDRVEGVVRQRIAYVTHPGWEVEAYLLFPERLPDRPPGYLVFHSTVDSSIRQPAGLADREQLAFGLQLARRGAVTLSPRNYLWPTNDRLEAQARAAEWLRQFPESTGMAKMLIDAQLALNLLASLPMVDAGALGAIGHSLGAKEVLYLAAFDERLRVAVSSEGGVGLGFSNWSDDWYLGDRIRRAEWTRDHHELLALAAPRAFLLVGGDASDGARSWPYIERGLAVYDLYRGAGQSSSSPLGLWNHGQGHAVPAEALPRLWQWLEAYV